MQSSAQLAALFVLLALVACPTGDAVTDIARERDLVGWLGDTYGVQQDGHQNEGRGRQSDRGVLVLSWDPKIFLYRGFLTDDECDYLVKHAQEQGEEDSTLGASFSLAESKEISHIEQRFSMLTMTPPNFGEGLWVRKHKHGEPFEASLDGAVQGKGNRLVTGVMFLSTVEQGGEFVFPSVDGGDAKARKSAQCPGKGLSVKPRKGDIVVFWTIKNDGKFDDRVEHGTCPVTKGELWTATKRIHVHAPETSATE